MRILLDHNVPVRFATLIAEGHEVRSTHELGWQSLVNGDLLSLADLHFEVLITLDKNMAHQTNLTGMQLRVAVLDARSNRIADVEPFAVVLLSQVMGLAQGCFTVIAIPPVEE